MKHNVDAYSVLREFQDQVATLLYHSKVPPRYLVLFVGTLRLTSTDFPFIDQVDTKSSQQVLDLLGKALRIEAMWDEGLECAKSRLASKGLLGDVAGYKLSLLRDNGIDLKELLPMEVEAFTFGDTIREVWVNCGAQILGCIHLFPNLKKLTCMGCIEEVHFKRLAKIKTLDRLSIGAKCLNEDVGLMTSLKYLSVETSDVGCIPTTIGLLTRLTDLVLEGRGFTQTIPSELGQLGELTSLTIEDTNVSGSIPSEVCQLKKLTELDLSRNPRLGGSLPKEFCKLRLLSLLSLHDTPVETKGCLHGWQHHVLSKSKSYWTRNVPYWVYQSVILYD